MTRLSVRSAIRYAMVFGLLLAAALLWNRGNGISSPVVPLSPDTNDLSTSLHSIGKLSLSDDVEVKAGDFWLEQTFTIQNNRISENLLQLYIGFEAKSQSGVYVYLKKSDLSLQIPLDVAEIGQSEKNKILLECPVPANEVQDVNGSHEQTLGVLWRKGELSIWLGSKELCATKLEPRVALLLKLPSAARSVNAAVHLGSRRVIPLDDIRFVDTFMRTTAGGDWKPLSGKWELTALTFPERSANPFSLRTSFGNEPPGEPKINSGRLGRDAGYGVGIIPDYIQGTLHVERITGGSPAAHAGLAEDDIFLEVDGVNVEQNIPNAVQLLFPNHSRDEIRFKVLRPGEKQIREFHINKENFRWGAKTVESILIEPTLPPMQLCHDSISFIRCGQSGWSDYRAEVSVKALGSGGFGLAVAMLSEEDCLLLRWRGSESPAPIPPLTQGGAAVPPPLSVSNCLELVRIKAGRETILAQKNAAYRLYEFYRLSVDWNGEDVTCRIDGNEMFHVKVPDLKRGYVGLLAMHGDPVFFDDVSIQSHHTQTVTAQDGGAFNSIFAHENDMERWANPALEWNPSLETGWAVHRSRFPGDQMLTLRNPRFNKIEMQAFTNSTLNEQYGVLVTIENGKATLGGGAWTQSTLDVGSGPFQRIVLRAGSNGGELLIDGKRLSFSPVKSFNSKSSIDTSKDCLFKENGCVALRGLKNLGDPAAVRVSSSNVLEYSFDNAPVDWKVESGVWGLLNKFICDPRWSWFGGRTKTVATLWNKNILSGDVTVEAHVALMMQKEEDPFERPGDYNMTLCGDGVRLDSGYTLIFGGDNNSWTRLYRKGILVAESNNELHRVFSDRIRHPDKPDLHQRWFRLTLEKLGDTVSFYRDGVKAFSFKDPSPIDKGQVAFWTMDNGVLISRVRIACDGKEPAPFESRRSVAFVDEHVRNSYDGEINTSTQLCKLPTVIKQSLQTPATAFQAADADVLPVNVNGNSNGVGDPPEAYRVTNSISGGPFVLQWRARTIDPENSSIVRFAYCIEPGAKVDIYLIDTSSKDRNPSLYNARNHGAYRWRLTGPEASDEFAPLVGTIPNIKADGRWHTVQYDVQPSWRMFWKSRGFSRGIDSVLHVMVGNLSNQGYLLAGFNGNAVGASYCLSNLCCFSARDVDNQPAKVSRVVWPFDPAGDGHTLSIYFEDAGGSGVKIESVNLMLSFQDRKEVLVPRELWVFDDLQQRVSVNLLSLAQNPSFALRLPNAFKEGDVLRFKMLDFEDRAGNASPGFKSEWTYTTASVSAAKKMPAAPFLMLVINGVPEPVSNILPIQLQQIVRLKEHMQPRLQESSDAPAWAPVSQRTSLQTVCPQDGHQFGFELRRPELDLRRWQYLQLDYKVPFETPFNLYMNDAQGVHALILTDLEDDRDYKSGDVRSHFGPPEDFVADGTWRRSRVPMYRLFAQANSLSTGVVSGFSFHDHGWRGTRRGMNFWMHRVVPVPAVKASELSFLWQAYDLSGTPDYAVCVDGEPQTDPSGRVEINQGETLEASLRRRNVTLKEGWNYIHLRSRNGVGLWSETVHRAFFFDQTGPKIVRSEPIKESVFAGRTIRVFVEDASGIHLPSLQININERVISGTANGVRFDPTTQCISIDTQKLNVSWPDKSNVKVEVRMLSDTLGNGLDAPYVFSFKADTSSDREGPAISQMYWRSVMAYRGLPRQMDLEVSFALNFEEHLGHVRAMRDCKLEWLKDPMQSAGGHRAVKFTALHDDADVQIMLHKNPWYIDQMPLFHFDYNVDENFKVDLLLEIKGEWYSIGFTGSGKSSVPQIGTIENVIADGQWHHASVDLRTLIYRALPNLSVRIINKIILSSQGQDGSKRGRVLKLDNVDLVNPMGVGGRIVGGSSDTSGVAGYAYLVDQSAETIPPSIVNLQSEENAPFTMPVGGSAGVWYAHVRAIDHAGNWSATKHLRLNFGE